MIEPRPEDQTSRIPRRDELAAAQRAAQVTIRDGKAGLPFSKGLLATSIMAAGLPPGRAYHVAEKVEVALHAEGLAQVTTAELRSLTETVLAEEVGNRYAETYRRWQTAQERDVPLIVLIGGTTGVGKSTVATTVANRLGIVRIVSTDAVREVMRGIFTREMMPALHASSFDVWTLIPEPLRGDDPVIAGFRQQVHAVSVGVTQLIRRAVVEGTDLIIEGAHIVPGVIALPDPSDAIVAQQIIAVDDAVIHANHFAARDREARTRGLRRYLDHFDDIRRIQDYLKGLAQQRGVPVITSYGLDQTVSMVMEAVIKTATDPRTPQRDPADPPEALNGSEQGGREIRLDPFSTTRGSAPRSSRQE